MEHVKQEAIRALVAQGVPRSSITMTEVGFPRLLSAVSAELPVRITVTTDGVESSYLVYVTARVSYSHPVAQ